MNLVSLVVAIISINIALNSYQAAQESGRQQQQTLDASKEALSSVVGALKKQEGIIDDSRQTLRQSIDIMTEQQKLLQQSVETSRNQLAVLDAQWKRQLEQPDIHAVLVYPTKPAVIVIISPILSLSRMATISS
jgi:chromosome segregation ATPase